MHAINALLQGPCFTNHQLQGVAAHYEAEEANLVGTAPGANADPHGNYSVQVLLHALSHTPGTRADYATGAAGRSSAQAFLVHHADRQHWVAYRRLRADFLLWVIFDSLLPEGPTWSPL